MLTYLVCLLSFAARFVSAHQQHLRTVPLSSTGKEEDNSLHRSTITCPSRENDTVSDALDLISRNYLTAPWLEGGVMTLNDFEWTTITTSLGGFTTPNVFISLPKLPGTVSNEGVSAMPRVKTVSFLTVNGEWSCDFPSQVVPSKQHLMLQRVANSNHPCSSDRHLDGGEHRSLQHYGSCLLRQSGTHHSRRLESRK